MRTAIISICVFAFILGGCAAVRPAPDYPKMAPVLVTPGLSAPSGVGQATGAELTLAIEIAWAEQEAAWPPVLDCLNKEHAAGACRDAQEWLESRKHLWQQLSDRQLGIAYYSCRADWVLIGPATHIGPAGPDLLPWCYRYLTDFGGEFELGAGWRNYCTPSAVRPGIFLCKMAASTADTGK
jgi:hypothetical protein